MLCLYTHTTHPRHLVIGPRTHAPSPGFVSPGPALPNNSISRVCQCLQEIVSCAQTLFVQQHIQIFEPTVQFYFDFIRKNLLGRNYLNSPPKHLKVTDITIIYIMRSNFYESSYIFLIYCWHNEFKKGWLPFILLF